MSDLETLAALADGIIPPDGRDAGAGVVQAGARLVEKLPMKVYREGVEAAEALARECFAREVRALGPEEIHELLAILREKRPAFFKQLRMDVSALYLSDPAVWARIGFPGPSTATQGYPDFDRPQSTK